jgi:hypothetical protein
MKIFVPKQWTRREGNGDLSVSRRGYYIRRGGRKSTNVEKSMPAASRRIGRTGPVVLVTINDRPIKQLVLNMAVKISREYIPIYW